MVGLAAPNVPVGVRVIVSFDLHRLDAVTGVVAERLVFDPDDVLLFDLVVDELCEPLRPVGRRETFLSRPLFGHLATNDPAWPRESPVWYRWGDEAAWILGDATTDTFPDRVEREAACALGVVEYDAARRLVQHVGIRAAGSVEPFDRELAERLLARYLGPDRDDWDRRFSEYLANPTETALLVRVEPDTVVGRDQSYASAPVR